MAEARWLEISLLVDGELAEAVADVLGRFVSNGVVMEHAVSFDHEEVEGTPAGPVRVFGYLPFDAHLEDKRRRLEEALWHLSCIQPLPEPSYRAIDDQDWMASWKEHYHPIPVGERLLIVPAWIQIDAAHRIPVRIDPSMAFGTGTHPTTQLCLELIEKYVRPDRPVIDVGCGSGILSIAALKLGASQALAVDVDSAAVRAAQENAAANGLLGRLELGLGSVIDVLEWKFTLASAPLVLANILASTIIRLFDEGLGDLVEPGGHLILSGILTDQAPAVIEAAIPHGLRLVEQRSMSDWVALVVQK